MKLTRFFTVLRILSLGFLMGLAGVSTAYFYVDVQGGIGFERYNQILLIPETLDLTEIGSGSSESVVLQPHFSRTFSTSVIGRIAMGYSINSRFTVEAGYNPYQVYHNQFSGFSNAAPNSLIDTTKKTAPVLFALYSGTQKLTLRNSIDVIAKVILPFDFAHVYFNAGAVVMSVDFGKKEVNVSFPEFIDNNGKSTNPLIDSQTIKLANPQQMTLIRPVIGAGLSYPVTQHISIEIFYSHIVGQSLPDSESPATNKLPGIHQLMMGLSYVFP